MRFSTTIQDLIKRNSGLFLFLAFFSLSLAVVRCGPPPEENITEEEESEEEEKEEEESETGSAAEGEIPEPTDAQLTSFKENIKPGLESGCLTAGCHASQKIAGVLLKEGADLENRKALLKYQKTTGKDLFKKLSNQVAHGGQVQSSVLPKAKVDAWLIAEKIIEETSESGSGTETETNSSESSDTDTTTTDTTTTDTTTTGSTDKFTVGGTITGMTGTLTLQNNAGDDLNVTSSGSFTFATAMDPDADYSVTVSSQPTGHSCTVTNGSGTVSANVTNVTITCTITDAAVAFSLLINPTFSTTCIGCHVSDHFSQLKISGTDASANQNTLSTYVSANGIDKVKTKVSGGENHYGGDLTSSLPLADIDAWHQLEQNE